MNTILIENYLQNISTKKQRRLMEVLKYIGTVVENGVLSRVFTLPGYTVEGIPVCNFKFKGKKIIMRFFQKDVFAALAGKIQGLECGGCSISFENVDEIQNPQVEELIRITVRTVRVDAAFLRSIRMRDYGYYDNVLLKPRRK